MIVFLFCRYLYDNVPLFPVTLMIARYSKKHPDQKEAKKKNVQKALSEPYIAMNGTITLK